MRAIIPIKSTDIVVRSGQKYFVKAVRLTGKGPILHLLPLSDRETVLHVSEVSLMDESEKRSRVKSIKSAFSNQQIRLPEGMSKSEAERILGAAAKRRQVK